MMAIRLVAHAALLGPIAGDNLASTSGSCYPVQVKMGDQHVSVTPELCCADGGWPLCFTALRGFDTKRCCENVDTSSLTGPTLHFLRSDYLARLEFS